MRISDWSSYVCSSDLSSLLTSTLIKQPQSLHRAIEPAECQITCVWRVAHVPGSILLRLTKHPGLPSGHVDDGQHGKAASPVPLSVEVPFLAVGQQLLEEIGRAHV